MSARPPSRRRFLEMSSLLVLAPLHAACGHREGSADVGSTTEPASADGTATDSTGASETGSTGTGSTGTGSTETGDAVCESTPPQLAGPFPQAGIERTMLNLYGHAGVALTLSGRVLDEGCAPVVGAQVLIWHASPSPPGVVPATLTADRNYTSAVYDHANQAGSMTPDGAEIPTGEQMYYGWTTTDGDGRYSFSTLRPGWYLNGQTYRPAHLHIRVFIGGREQLTTQLYFPDDPFNEADSIQANACAEDCFVVYANEDGSEASFDVHVSA